MKKLTYITLLIIGFLFIACKKDNNKTEPVVIATTGNANTTITNGLPANTNNINGVLLASKLYFPSFTFTKYSSYAGFSTTPYSLSIANPLLEIISGFSNADTVKINNRDLLYSPSTATVNANQYSDTLQSANYIGGVNWYVKGNSNFSSFNTIVTRGFPNFGNSNILPTSISVSIPLTINLSSANITNADSINVMLSDAASSYMITKTVAPNITSVNFSANELSGLTVGSTSAQIFIFTKNYSFLTANNKTHIFIMFSNIGGFMTVNP